MTLDRPFRLNKVQITAAAVAALVMLITSSPSARAAQAGRFHCQHLGTVRLLWRAGDVGADGRRAARVWYRGHTYQGYWDGGTLQTFTPTTRGWNAPWLVYSRTGRPNMELYLGKTSWLPGATPIFRDRASCQASPS